MRKGITPIISIVVLLLIAVAVAGAAYTWISGYFGGLTGTAIQVSDVRCVAGGTPPKITIRFQNIGTDALDTANKITISRSVVGTGTTATAFDVSQVSYNPTNAGPGQLVTVTDLSVSATDAGLTFRYDLLLGGRVTTAQVTC